MALGLLNYLAGRTGRRAKIERQEVFRLKRVMEANLFLGLWLMVSPFILEVFNHTILRVLWEDFLLGFGIAAFSLCRLLARYEREIALTDGLITALAFLTLINPILYGYLNLKFAAWNNLTVGAIILFAASYQDWQDSDISDWQLRR